MSCEPAVSLATFQPFQPNGEVPDDLTLTHVHMVGVSAKQQEAAGDGPLPWDEIETAGVLTPVDVDGHKPIAQQLSWATQDSDVRGAPHAPPPTHSPSPPTSAHSLDCSAHPRQGP